MLNKPVRGVLNSLFHSSQFLHCSASLCYKIKVALGISPRSYLHVQQVSLLSIIVNYINSKVIKFPSTSHGNCEHCLQSERLSTVLNAELQHYSLTFVYYATGIPFISRMT